MESNPTESSTTFELLWLELRGLITTEELLKLLFLHVDDMFVVRAGIGIDTSTQPFSFISCI